MYLRALLVGICIAFNKGRYSISPSIVKQAVINLGGSQYVEHKENVWWIKDYYNIPYWKVIITRLKILNRVNGLNALKEEVNRLAELEQRSYVPFTPPFHLRSDDYLCHQIAEYVSPTGVLVSLNNLGQILHEMGCPGVDPAEHYWVEAGNPSTEAGRAARKEIIQFILKHWQSIRMMLISRNNPHV